MKLTTRDDWAVSEVIGAVLLVGLVVVGGAVAGMVYFSQAQPKGMPHLSFSVDHKNESGDLTLYHTGGDTLAWDEFKVYVDGNDNTTDVKPDHRNRSWSFNQPLTIEGIHNTPGTVVLTFVGSGSGETILRKVVYTEDGKPHYEPVSPEAPIGSISGYKLNASDEMGLDEWTIKLQSKQGNNWIDGPTTVTDATGYYHFDALANGDYQVEEILKPLWVQKASPSVITLTDGANASVRNNFTNEYQPSVPPLYPGVISGSKWNDLSENGVWDDVGEPGLGNWTINLYDASGHSRVFLKSTVTDPDGSYRFDNLSHGKYFVNETLQTGWRQTHGNDNEIEISNGAGNQEHPGINFGNHNTASQISGTLSGFALITPGDAGATGAIVQLSYTNGTLVRPPVTINQTGAYLFATLPAGDYTVSQIPPDGYSQLTPPDNGVYTRTINPSNPSFTSLNFTDRQIPAAITGTLSGYLWLDSNADGLFTSPGEVVLNEFVVNLSCPNGSVLQTTTSGYGNYSFANLPAGTYTVSPKTRADFFQVFPAGNAGYTRSIETNGQVIPNLNFGLQPDPTQTPVAYSGRIAGAKYEDKNGDGNLDNDEPFIRDWPFVLMKDGSVVNSTRTNANGAYEFSNISPGIYRIREDAHLTNWHQTSEMPADITITETSSPVSGIDFGNQNLSSIPVTRGRIMGRVFNDVNLDGSSSGEPGLGGWTVELYAAANGTLLRSTSSGSSPGGLYSFDSLPAGIYRVREVQQDGWYQTTIDPNDIIFDEGKGDLVQENVDFGNAPIGTEPEDPPGKGAIEGQKYEDTDGDSSRDSNEPYLSGWVIQVYDRKDDDGPLLGTDITDGNGFYHIGGLELGASNQYLVKEVMKSGWRQTQGQPDKIKLKDKDATGKNFGNQRLSPTTVPTTTAPTTATSTVTQTTTATATTATPTTTSTPAITENGVVIELDKQIGGRGRLLDGTYYTFEANKNKDVIKVDGRTVTIPHNTAVVKLVIDGDQYVGQMVTTKLDLIEFSFRVKVYVDNQLVDQGMVTEIFVNNINKNKYNPDSTLTYQLDSAGAYTHLDINGVNRIEGQNSQPMTVSNIHIIHDNRYHEGNNVRLIALGETSNYLLCQANIGVWQSTA